MPTLVMGSRRGCGSAQRGERRAEAGIARALGRRLMELGTALVIAVGSMVVLVPRGLGEAWPTTSARASRSPGWTR